MTTTSFSKTPKLAVDAPHSQTQPCALSFSSHNKAVTHSIIPQTSTRNTPDPDEEYQGVSPRLSQRTLQPFSYSYLTGHSPISLLFGRESPPPFNLPTSLTSHHAARTQFTKSCERRTIRGQPLLAYPYLLVAHHGPFCRRRSSTMIPRKTTRSVRSIQNTFEYSKNRQ